MQCLECSEANNWFTPHGTQHQQSFPNSHPHPPNGSMPCQGLLTVSDGQKVPYKQISSSYKLLKTMQSPCKQLSIYHGSPPHPSLLVCSGSFPPLSSIIYSQLPPSSLSPCSHSRSPIIVARNNMDSFSFLGSQIVSGVKFDMSM